MFKFKSVFLLLLIATSFSPAQAQEPTTIQLVTFDIFADTLRRPIEQFQELNPDIVVEFVPAHYPHFIPGDDIETYLDDIAAYVSSGDVIVGGPVDILTTRAGYFLDLSPLIFADSEFNPDDFFSAMWQNYQWDGGIWGLMLAGDVAGLGYDANAFDYHGLSYPDDDWTLDDLQIAVEQIAVRSQSGAIMRAPITNYYVDSGSLAIALLDTPVYDPTQLGGVPSFDNPELVSLIEQLVALEEGGYIYDITNSIETSEILLTDSISTQVVKVVHTAANHRFTALPNGVTLLSGVGASISTATQYPEEAYRLLKFMTQDPEVFTAMIGQPIPANRALIETDTSSSILTFAVPEDMMVQVLEYVETALPGSHYLFDSYISRAIDMVVEGEADIVTALDAMEQQALSDLQAAEARRGSVLVVDAVPDTIIPAGDIELTFGIAANGRIPNREEWEAAATEFVGNDPQVGNIELVSLTLFSGNSTTNDFAERADCFYQPTRLDMSQDLAVLLPIDPLLSVATDISRNDFAGDTLTLLSQNGVIYGLPLHLQPEVMYYNADLFNAIGADLPYQDWTITDFEMALRTLHTDPDNPPPFDSRSFDGTYALTLIAAYGGLPFDYRTEPTTVDFTSDANMNAIQQFLDLAKAGLIQYDPLTPGSPRPRTVAEPILYSQVLSDLFIFNNFADADNAPNYQMVAFPQGRDLVALHFDVGGAYITTRANYPEACFRFITFLSERHTLFRSMPARRSVIESDILRQLEGDTTIEFYRHIDAMLQNPDVVVFPAGANIDLSQADDFGITNWLYRAMDRYVFEDADLLTELELAQDITNDYQICVARIPPYDAQVDDPFSYLQLFVGCGEQVNR